MSSETRKRPTKQPAAEPPLDYANQEWDFENVDIEDDTPVDNLYSLRQMVILSEALGAAWSGPGDNRPFLAVHNVGLFYEPGVPPLVPDMMLSVDIACAPDASQKKTNSYFISVFGKPPDVVVEIVSNTKGGEDSTKKKIYARIGVPYYVIWDPEEWLKIGRLNIYKLHGKSYKGYQGMWFPEVNLGLKFWHANYRTLDEDWLRWCDREGNLIPIPDELARLAEQETKRAEQETKRAEQEAKRADEAVHELALQKQRGEELAARLRDLEAKIKGTEKE